MFHRARSSTEASENHELLPTPSRGGRDGDATPASSRRRAQPGSVLSAMLYGVATTALGRTVPNADAETDTFTPPRGEGVHDRVLNRVMGKGAETVKPASSGKDAAGGNAKVENEDTEAKDKNNRQDTSPTMKRTRDHAPVPLTPGGVFPPGPEDIFDPASGHLVGLLRNAVPLDEGESSTTSRKRHDTSSDKMWAQMAKIRSIQSEIAKMHASLDTAGIVVDSIKDRKGTASSAASMRSANLTDPGMGFFGRNRSMSEAPPPQVSDDEFARRKENVGEIMKKLKVLSEAVTTLHAQPPPPLDFPPASHATHSHTDSLSPSNSLDSGANGFDSPNQASPVFHFDVPSSHYAKFTPISSPLSAPPSRFASPNLANNPPQKAGSPTPVAPVPGGSPAMSNLPSFLVTSSLNYGAGTGSGPVVDRKVNTVPPNVGLNSSQSLSSSNPPWPLNVPLPTTHGTRKLSTLYEPLDSPSSPPFQLPTSKDFDPSTTSRFPGEEGEMYDFVEDSGVERGEGQDSGMRADYAHAHLLDGVVNDSTTTGTKFAPVVHDSPVGTPTSLYHERGDR
ncbi:uncharacterized protein EI90DRAFT_3116183 [Cantharellus anzutake]|uniref:uncharacterized protein n=1 Tax=Cantharellus anzutake TaxID=1750568 RepID=UPI00190888A1|nr:uncharacterized protein EI90DRAFT_3116183 [Cantharellus anzutake]KAF8342263.1 hypothetical protein EI90DRAFT_3116183 [Cantharellus anzutake]